MSLETGNTLCLLHSLRRRVPTVKMLLRTKMDLRREPWSDALSHPAGSESGSALSAGIFIPLPAVLYLP